jgi:hypothetical protein
MPRILDRGPGRPGEPLKHRFPAFRISHGRTGG